MISNELWAAQIYSGEGMYAVNKNSTLEYIIPEEGFMIWVDNLVISRDTQHKYTAEVFINYILEPKVSAKIANYNWYANCNIVARLYTLKEIIKNPILYPSKEKMERGEFFLQVGNINEIGVGIQTLNKIWSELNTISDKKE